MVANLRPAGNRVAGHGGKLLWHGSMPPPLAPALFLIEPVGAALPAGFDALADAARAEGPRASDPPPVRPHGAALQRDGDAAPRPPSPGFHQGRDPRRGPR